MLSLFIEGGYPMFLLVTFGLATLVFAGRFALAPVRRTLRIVFALAGATAFTTLTGICTDLSAVGHQLPGYRQAHPDTTLIDDLLMGVAESLAPAILGFTILSLAALIVALGLHRETLT